MNLVHDTSAAPPNLSFSSAVPLAKPALYRQLRLLIAAVVIPMFLLSVASVVSISQNTKERTAEGILQTARGVMGSTDAELKGYISALRLLAESPSLRSDDMAAFKAEAERFVATFPGDRSNVVLSDADGNIVFSVLPVRGPLKRGSLTGVREVFTNKKPYVSDMYVGAITGLPLFTIDVPVIKDGAVAYSLAFNPSRDAFYRITDAVNLPAGWVISIFDRAHRHVARTPSLGREELTSAADSLQVELAKAREGAAATTSLEGVDLLTAYTRSNETGWMVAIGVPAEYLSASVNQALALAVALSALFYIGAAAFAYRLARAVTRAENERELLINELNHRVKNTLAAVQAIVSQTLRRSGDLTLARGSVQNRLTAMSRAHNILSERNWTDADLAEVVKVVLQAYEDGAMQQVRMDGPSLTLRPRRAIPLAMIVNELATNALKYGALSSADGRLIISWRRTELNGLVFVWEEVGARAGVPPETTGFGTFFIERAVVHELSGEIAREYTATGLKVTIQIPLEAPPGQ